LEFLFASCGVTDNAKKKALGIRYVDYNTSEQWLSILEYQPYDPSQPDYLYSYDNWKRAVISLYPGANAATKYSMADLDQIMGKAAHTDIKTIGQFADYYQKFYQVSKWLTDSGRIGSLKRDRFFGNGLGPNLWSNIQHCLSIKERDVRPGDPYTMTQMKAATEFVLRGTNTSVNGTKYSQQTPGLYTRNKTPYFGQSKITTPIPTIKVEETKKRFADMDHKLETILATLQKLTTNGGSINNGALRNGRCLFCGKTGHTIHGCYEADRYLQSGQAI
ncbi:hypothetical protein C0991_005525, partial [Blastosporella zonata]